LSFEYGQATAKVVGGELNLDAVLAEGLLFESESTVRRWTLAGFIGSNYSFFDEQEPEGE
jgi:hypothetical protein